ncbi:MAG: ATP-NAD kinase family protein [Thermoplasmatales archaeon]
MKKVGFIVNPVAGLGGRVGLKGTDTPQIVEEAIKMGATVTSPEKGYRALEKLKGIGQSLELLTCSGDMGENTVKKLGFNFRIAYEAPENTTRNDTVNCARKILNEGADILIFAGGDGTARDICEAVGDKIVVLGVPAGVKMYSSCFAVTPEAAGELALTFLSGQDFDIIDAEVLDVDEELFRKGILSTKLYCYLKTPYEKLRLQGAKVASNEESEKVYQEAIASYLVENLQKGHYYIIGPGTTAKYVLKMLGIESNVLGVDVIFVKETGAVEVVGTDMNEVGILKLISNVDSKKLHLIVTPLGGQGFLLGRGNQQISPAIIDKVGKEGITVIATWNKIRSFDSNCLLLDTGSPDTDRKLEGYYKVVTGYHTFYMLRARSFS